MAHSPQHDPNSGPSLREPSSRRPELLAPLDSVRPVREFVEAGADRFYCGLALLDVRARTNTWELENGRDDPTASVSSLETLGHLAAEVHGHGRKLALAVNRLYPDSVRPAVEASTAAAIEAGVDEIILSDLGLARFVRERFPGVPVVASTIMGLHNPAALGLAAELGIHRVVLPRAMRLEEIRRLATGPGPDLEVFFARERCRFENAYCRGEHRVPSPDGMTLETATPVCMSPLRDDSGRWWFLDDGRRTLESCGLCALAHLGKLERVTAFKLVGRGASPQSRLRFLRLARRIIDDGLDEEAVRQAAREAGVLCSPGTCYYPPDVGPPPSLRPAHSVVELPAIPAPGKRATASRWLFLPPNLGEVSLDTTAATGLYVGHETCFWLLPSPNRIRRLVESALRANLAIALVLPPLFGDRELAVGVDLVGVFAKALGRPPEITVNDIGSLWAIRRLLGPEASLSLGRAMVGQRTDPRLNRWLAGSDPQGMVPALGAGHLRELVELAGVDRLELSSSRRWPDWENMPVTDVTVHLGPALLAIGRACPSYAARTGLREDSPSFVVPRNCDRGCIGRDRPGSIEATTERFLLSGNALWAPVPSWYEIPKPVRRIVHHTGHAGYESRRAALAGCHQSSGGAGGRFK